MATKRPKSAEEAKLRLKRVFLETGKWDERVNVIAKMCSSLAESANLGGSAQNTLWPLLSAYEAAADKRDKMRRRLKIASNEYVKALDAEKQK